MHHVDVMDFQLQYGGTFFWGFGWNYLYHKTWYKQKLQSVEKHQFGGKAPKLLFNYYIAVFRQKIYIVWLCKETSNNEHDWNPGKYLNVLYNDRTQKQLQQSFLYILQK